MRLYSKKLRNVKDLEKERKRLLRQKRELDAEEIFSLKGVLGDDTARGGLGVIADMLPVSPLVSMGIKMVGRIFSRKKNKEEEQHEYAPPSDGVKKKKSRSLLMKVGTELVGGYLKWKAAELSYKGAKAIIKNRRENKQD